MGRLLRFLERAFMVAGVVLLAAVTGAMIHAKVGSRLALAEFDDAQAAAAHGTAQQNPDAPIAVVSIAKLSLRVPVFGGTSDIVLNRGAGWIEGTSRPGDTGSGTIGLAGHRDGFFRSVKDIAVGDEIELSTLGATSVYTVDGTEIVTPEDVAVLRPRGVPSLALVTCYPFNYIGNAPKRFIVHATLKRRGDPATSR